MCSETSVRCYQPTYAALTSHKIEGLYTAAEASNHEWPRRLHSVFTLGLYFKYRPVKILRVRANSHCVTLPFRHRSIFVLSEWSVFTLSVVFSHLPQQPIVGGQR